MLIMCDKLNRDADDWLRTSNDLSEKREIADECRNVANALIRAALALSVAGLAAERSQAKMDVLPFSPRVGRDGIGSIRRWS